MGSTGSKGIDAHRRRNAQRLRSRQTGAEEQLWKALKAMPIAGSHFRRQVPVPPYVADFACLAARLIIEIDGSQHAEPDGIARDVVRTKALEAQGFRVLRFWNSDVSGNLQPVLDAIYVALYGSLDASATPLTPPRLANAKRPSPSRGG
jgi:very-short-patch-repair endonuclease